MKDNIRDAAKSESWILPKAVIFPARKIKPRSAKSVIDKISNVSLHQDAPKLCKNGLVRIILNDTVWNYYT